MSPSSIVTFVGQPEKETEENFLQYSVQTVNLRWGNCNLWPAPEHLCEFSTFVHESKTLSYQTMSNYYHAPGRGTGFCFRSISLFVSSFVSLSATLRENVWTDLHEIFKEGVEWPWDDLIQFWVNSGKRVGGSNVKLFVINGHSSESVAFARWQQRTGVNKS